MARVFVSYSSTNLDVARWLHDSLTAASHDVFLDRDVKDGIGGGDDWAGRLGERLRWADAVVCVVTQAYVESVWCSAEVAVAMERGAVLLPVRGDTTKTHPLLPQIQHITLPEVRAEVPPALLQALARLDIGGGRGWPDDRSPFPGLRAFETDMTRVFFGREQEVKDLGRQLRAPGNQPVVRRGPLLVVGPSGAGKSSLVRAGLVSMMAAHPGWWVVPPFTPGEEPTAMLAVALAQAARDTEMAWTASEIHHRLRADDGLLLVAADLLATAPATVRPERLLLVIDQFEELVTQSTAAERSRMARLLSTAMAGSVRVVGTLRAELLDQVLADPAMAKLPPEVFPLHPLAQEYLASVIRRPAEIAGLTIDDELVEAMVADTGTGDALPLLAFALSALTEGLGRGGRLLSQRYKEIGGVKGALSQQADAALERAVQVGGRTRDEVIKGLVTLTTVDADDRPVGRRLAVSAIPQPVRGELDVFVEHRLLISDGVPVDQPPQGDPAATTTLRFAHESLLSAWEPLQKAVTEDRIGLRTQRDVERAAADWQVANRPTDQLWAGGHLAATAENLRAHPVPSRWVWLRPGRLPQLLTTPEIGAVAGDFLATSIRRDRLSRARFTIGLAALLVVAVGAAAFAVVQNGAAQAQRETAQEQRKIAIARQLMAQATAVLDEDPRTALMLGAAAHAIHPGEETDSGLFETLVSTPYTYSRTLTGLPGWVNSVAFSSDGKTMATGSGGNGSVLLWDVSSQGRPPVQLGKPLNEGNGNSLGSLVFSPDGRTLAASFQTGGWSVLLWDISDRSRPVPIGQPIQSATDDWVSSLAVSPDGRTLVTAQSDGIAGSVVLWDVSGRGRPVQVGKPLTVDNGGTLTSLVFSRDGTTIAVGDSNGSVFFWDLSIRSRPVRIGQPIAAADGWVSSMAFSPDSETLVTGCDCAGGGQVLLWDVSDRGRPVRIGQPLTGHIGGVTSVAFSPDGTTLAVSGGGGSAGGLVLLWDVSARGLPLRIGQPLTGHTGSVNSVAFSPDGTTLAAACGELTDGSVLLWDVSARGLPLRIGQPLTGHTGSVNSVAFSPDGATLAVAGGEGADGSVLLRNVSDSGKRVKIGRPLGSPTGGWVSSVVFSPDGGTLAIAGTSDGRNGSVLLWDVSDRGRPVQIGQPLTGLSASMTSVVFSPDGTTLAGGGGGGSSGGSVLLWDVSDRGRPQRLAEPLAWSTEGWVSSVVFSPDGGTLAVAGGIASGDGQVLLWDVSDRGRPLRLGEPLSERSSSVSSVTFSPDGGTLAVGGEDLDGGSVLLWDVSDPSQPVRTGHLLTERLGSMKSVAFSPDGMSLAGGIGVGDSTGVAVGVGVDASVLLWDVSDRSRLRRIGQPLTGQTGSVNSVAFSPNGKSLVSGSSDRSVLVWRAEALVDLDRHTVESACGRLDRGLTEAQWSEFIDGIDYRETCTG